MQLKNSECYVLYVSAFLQSLACKKVKGNKRRNLKKNWKNTLRKSLERERERVIEAERGSLFDDIAPICCIGEEYVVFGGSELATLKMMCVIHSGHLYVGILILQ